MDTHSPNFADSWEIRELLSISKSQLDALDRSRIFDGHIVGVDSFAKLKISTVFAAISIEAALNDFIQVHCLLVQFPYLQTYFVEITKKFLRASTEEKIRLLRKCWHEPFPDDLIKDVNQLFRIRNHIVHQRGRFLADENSSHGIQGLSNDPLSGEDLQHMLRHHDIAEDFLSRFWMPGNVQVQQGLAEDDMEHT